MVGVHRTCVPTYTEAVGSDQEELYEWSTQGNDPGAAWFYHNN
jgi:hypothetical protein